MQEKLTEQKLNALPKSTPQRERFKLQEKRNVHRKKHDEMLLAYRRHNADDYIMRFHFTHQARVAQALDAVRKRPAEHTEEIGQVEVDRIVSKTLAEAARKTHTTEGQMVQFYGGCYEEPVILNYFAPVKCRYMDHQLHKETPKWVPLTTRKQAKDQASANGKKHGAMKIATSQARALGHWCSTPRAQKHWRADLTPAVRKRTLIDGLDEEQHRQKCRRVNYITRR